MHAPAQDLAAPAQDLAAPTRDAPTARDATTARNLPAHVHAVVVGSGFAGLAAAIRLGRSGRDYVVLERGHDVAGTWRDNSYPGCACDVPSHLYSFSFAPNPDWSRSFSPQPEIYAYLQRTAANYGVLPHVWFDAEVLAADWDTRQQHWTVRSAAGELTCDVLILGTGGLSDPSIPALPGLESFAGTSFHSATWAHDHDLTGERVAVIGTGASAIQFVPEIQPQVARLTVFQRTAPWVLPRRDRAIGAFERWVYRRVPRLQKAVRAGIYWGRESWVVGFAVRPSLMKLAEQRALRDLHRQVPDPSLRAKLTPSFRLGCKRVLLSNDYYPTLTRPNVEVVTDRIVEIRPHAVMTVDADGHEAEHPVDTIVFGTGFHVTDPPIAHRIRGRDGATLAEHWAGTGMSALHGLTVHGFPNLFVLVGPNTGLGHTSIVFMIETQVRYLVALLEAMAARGLRAVEPRHDVQHAENADLQRRLATTVWNAGGCASWYLDSHGRNTTLWPTFTVTFRRRLATLRFEEYRVVQRTAAVERLPA